MLIYILICVLLILFTMIFIVFAINSNRFSSILIKINEAEENIKVLLNEKYNLLLLIKETVSNTLSKEVFNSIDEIKIEDLNSFELNNELSKFDKEVIELRDFNKDIELSEDNMKLFDDLDSIDTECVASEKYYNDNVNLFNKLINSFPSNIIAKIKRYKEKDLYSNKKEEIFEILKQ